MKTVVKKEKGKLLLPINGLPNCAYCNKKVDKVRYGARRGTDGLLNGTDLEVYCHGSKRIMHSWTSIAHLEANPNVFQNLTFFGDTKPKKFNFREFIRNL